MHARQGVDWALIVQGFWGNYPTRQVTRFEMRIPLILLATALENSASAATITVTTTDDVVAANGQCSLREAITAANNDAAFNGCPAGSGSDEIVLGAAEYRFDIKGAGEDANASGDLDIRSNLTLRGAGADLTRIRGDREDRVLDIALPATNVLVTGLTLRNGAGALGAGILVNAGSSVVVRAVLLTGNAADQGGGIASFGIVDIDGSTFHANDAAQGGAIWNGGSQSSSFASLRNVTLDSNTALGSGSAASFNAPASLNNVTASQNIADSDLDDVGNGAIEVNAVVTISNTIVARNVDLSLGGTALVNPDCAIGAGGNLVSAGYNLLGILGNACVLGNIQPNDQAGNAAQPLNPLLQAFDLYGGTVEVFLPTAASPAVQAGNPLPPAGGSTCELVDARGVVRPQGSRCDIGAAELEGLDDLVFRDGFDPPLP